MNAITRQRSQCKLNLLILVTTFWALLLSGAHAGTAVGNPGDAPTVNNLVSEAEFIFQGSVVDIQYATSTPKEKGDLGIPYTFVTYRLDNLLKGSIDQSAVTLRFLGGKRESDGAILKVSHTPTFKVGEEDILFVQGNTVDNRPLAHWKFGRLRVYGNRIYDNAGREIQLSSKGEIQLGKFNPNGKTEDSTVNTGLDNGDANLSNARVSSEMSASKAITVEAFISVVDNARSKTVKAPDRAPVTFVNADPSVPFNASLPGPVAAPSVITRSE